MDYHLIMNDTIPTGTFLLHMTTTKETRLCLVITAIITIACLLHHHHYKAVVASEETIHMAAKIHLYYHHLHGHHHLVVDAPDDIAPVMVVVTRLARGIPKAATMPIEQILQGWWIPSQPKRFSKGCTLFT
jgi:hypothetical protein